MHAISINSDQFTLPSRWNELTAPQFRHIVELVTRSPGYDEARLHLFLLFTGLRVLQKPHHDSGKWILTCHRPKKQYVLATWQLVDLSSRLTWIFAPVDSTIQQFSVSCRLTRNLLPKIRVRSSLFTLHSSFFGPSDGLANLRFAEYIYAETAHSKFLDTNDEQYLNTLIAVLYRPRRWFVRTGSVNWNGDYRRDFNPFLTEKYRRSVASLSPVTKRMILMWYQACTLLFQRMFPDMFTRTAGKTNTEVFESFNDMVDSLADGDVTKKNAVRDAYLYDALKTINTMVRRSNELEKKLKSQRK